MTEIRKNATFKNGVKIAESETIVSDAELAAEKEAARNWRKEIDGLRSRVAALEAKP